MLLTWKGRSTLNKEELEKCGINYRQGMIRFMNNESLFEKFLLKFKDDKSYLKLKQALEQKDCEQAFHEAHTLKGLAGNLAMDALADVTSDVTEALRAENFELGSQLMCHVDKQYEQIIQLLEKLEK